jgi:hypothetical protein
VQQKWGYEEKQTTVISGILDKWLKTAKAIYKGISI